MSDKITDLSYSCFVEQKQQKQNRTLSENPLRYTLPRRIYTWMDDNLVTNCNTCDKQFNFIVRKHHCRFCGKIFCNNCSDYQATIPKDLLSESTKKTTWNDYFASKVFFKDPTKYKVCKGCLELIETIESVKKIIEVFLILNLDLKELKKATSVCKLWQNATNYIFSLFREIQYKLPHEEFNEIEKKLLYNNIQYLSGHNRFLTQFLRLVCTDKEMNGDNIINLIKKRKQVKCWTMMCTSSCKDKLTSFNAINIICQCYKKSSTNFVKSYILPFLNHPHTIDKEFKCYLPLLVYYLRFDDHILADFLIKRCVNNIELLNGLFWELKLFTKDNVDKHSYEYLSSKLMELNKDRNHEKNTVKIIGGHALTAVLETISKEICDNNKKYEDIQDSFKLKDIFTSPLNQHNLIKSINIEKIKIKNSASRPIIIPCVTTDNTTVHILLKKENVRKDQMILNIIRLVDFILKKEENIDLGLVIYNVLPINDESGLIEIVENSETIYHIQEKLGTSILNYILEENMDLKIKDVRDKFIKTTAGYCVMTYLFGVGDRHLDNVMITKDGRLFHIDFGYILGKDPIVAEPGIRITNEMIDALGGLSSKSYLYFTDLCTKIYNCLRRNTDIFMNMLLVLPKISDLKLSEDEIIEQIIKRFIPGENSIDAKLHLVNQLEKQSYIDKIKDWCHYHSKEQTINSNVTRFKTAFSKLLRSDIENVKKETK